MAKENLTIPTSTTVVFIDAQQVDNASMYYSFKFVSVNFIPERKAVLEPKLS